MRYTTHSVCCLLILAFLPGCKEDKQSVPSQAEAKQAISYDPLPGGSIESNDGKLATIIPEGTTIEVLAEGHDWTEGPLWVPEHNMLLYTDIPRNAVYAWKEGEASELYLKPSGFLGSDFTGEEPGANGLLLTSKGELVLCQHGERQVALMQSPVADPKPEYLPLAAAYKGKRFNSPNDAVFKSNGDLYFTDPPYGLPKRMEDPGKELTFQGVYKVDANGMVTLLTSEFSRPNGIAFSPDESKLYIANSDPEKAIWKVFEITGEGNLQNGREFFDATGLVATEKGLPDGLKVSKQGTVFATGPGGVFVFDAYGELLGKIKTGQATSNCALNPDESFLFITADSYLLRVALKN